MKIPGVSTAETIHGTGRLAPGGLHPDALRRGTQELAGYDILIFAALVVIGIHVLSLSFSMDLLRDRALVGPDDYTRMARVRDLLSNGWFGPVLERVGDGDLQHHWTRPMDAVIAGISHLIGIFLPPRDALYWAGLIASPLVHAGSVVATLAVLRKRLSADTLMTLILVLLLMPMFYLQFRLGRPDHHGLQIGLMSVLLAVTLRMVIDIEAAQPVRRWAWGAGGLSALLVWSTPGGLLPAMAVLGALGLMWVLRGGLYAYAGQHASAAAILGTLVALPLERGGAFAVLDPDRLSLIHVYTLAFATVVFASARLLESRLALGSPRKDLHTALRWGLAVMASVFGLVLASALFPSLLFADHFLEIDTFYRETRSVAINESQPVFALETASPSDVYSSLASLLSHGGLLLIAPFVALLALFRRPLSWPYVVPPLLIIAAYMAVYRTEHFGLIYKNSGYLSIAVIFLYAGLVGEATAHLRGTMKRGGMMAIIGIQFLAASWPMGFILPLALLGGNDSETDPREAGCGLHQISTELDALASETGPNARILAVPEISSELLHRTDFRVLAIATHRYQLGYRVMHGIFSENDPAQAHALMRDHNIAGVVTCESYEGYFDSAESPFHTSLLLGQTPNGFERLTNPEASIQIHVRDREDELQQ